MSILDIFYPKKCSGCQKKGVYFCKDCVGSSKSCFPQICPICGRASVDGVTHIRCKRRIYPEGLTSLWNYEGVSKKAILKLKYKFVSDLVEELSGIVVDKLKTVPQNAIGAPRWEDEKFTMVSIPLHWTKQNWRGFNHAEELAKAISVKMGWNYVNALSRTKMTRPQVGLREEERRRNMEGVFSLSPSLSPRFSEKSYSKVLLFDDVWTTGSTMLEATKVLKVAGFRYVWCLTLAR